MKKIGKLQVKQIIKTKYPKVKFDDSIKKVLNLFYKEKVNILPVFKNNKFIGEIYKADLLKLVVNTEKLPENKILKFGYSLDFGYFAKTAKDIMSLHKAFVKEDVLIEDIAWRMIQNSIRSMPVVNNKGKMIGILTVDEIIKNILNKK